MINYELALKLKEAGFPQIGDGKLLIYDDVIPTIPLMTISDYVREEKGGHPKMRKYEVFNPEWRDTQEAKDLTFYFPTLEELMKESGVKCLYKFGNMWVATPEDPSETAWENWGGIRIEGSNPEEAVANLYLATRK